MEILKKNIIKGLNGFDLIEWGLRLWMGYIMVTNSRVGTLIPLESLGMPDHVYQIFKGMWDTGFMMHSVKLIELLGGVMLIFNFRTPLAILLLSPVIFNIYGMHIFVFNKVLSNGLYMVLILAFLAYRHRTYFLPFFKKEIRNN